MMMATALGRSGARAVGRRAIATQAVMYERLGSPDAVMAAKEVKVGEKLGGTQVLVKMMAAPVGAVDLHAVAGRIPGVAKSGVCGNEGVGVVQDVGASVAGLKKGDHVVPTKLGMGTWAAYAVAEEAALTAVPKELDVEQASLLGSSAATALRVLADIAQLKAGDAVVVNGANSAVGMALVQIAKAKGLKVACVVGASTSDFKGASGALKAAGSDVVVDAGSAGSSAFRKACADLKPKLAVHCSSSSEDSTALARALAPGGTLVSVAGAAPVVIPSSLLIDRGIVVRGFNLAAALDGAAAGSTVSELVELVKAGKLKQAVASSEPLANYGKAVAAAAGANGAVLLKM